MRLKLQLAEKSDWVKVFDPRNGTIFVSPPDIPDVGESMRIDLEIGESGPRVILRGEVISRRDRPEAGAPAGCSVVLGPEEREKVGYLNGYVRGGLLNLRERRRIPVRIPVQCRNEQDLQDSFTRDINEQGVFVVSEEPWPEESAIQLTLQFPLGAQPVEIAGVVSHTVVIEDEDVPGMGIIFAFKGDEEQQAFHRSIDELEQAFLSGELPDECLL